MSKNDLKTEIISLGGTIYAWNSWPKFAYNLSMVNECRPGGYIFYDQIKVSEGVASLDKRAARILTTIVSKPAKGRVILDAGAA